MKVFIDGFAADIDERTEVSITLSVVSQSNLEESRTGYSKTIMLPTTPTNRKLLGQPEDVNAARRFNNDNHTARIEQDGCVVMEGVPQLAEAVFGGRGYYKLNIVGAGCDWVKFAASTPLSELNLPFYAVYSAQDIKNSWTWLYPVRFLPVHRPGLEPRNVNNNIVPPQRTLTADDYHPFLQLNALLKQVFADAGYTFRSAFFDTSLAHRYYISGNYATREVRELRSRIDFKAGRITRTAAVADRLGRVYATPYSNLNTVSNIVDTIDPAKSAAGVRAGDVFSNGGCFYAHPQGHMEFRPPMPATLAFEYNILYNTQYKLDTSTGKLKGFDTINLGSGNEYKFDLRLPFPDHKQGILQPNHSYKIFVYGHKPGDSYQYSYTEVTNPLADPDNLATGDTRGAVSTVSSQMPITVTVSNNIRMRCKVRVRKGGTSTFVDVPESEWGLYDGSMSLTGTMDVEVTLRTQAFEVTPNKPKTFYDVYFGGADSSMQMTILPGTTLRPVFVYGATEGAALDYKSVAAHDNISCLDLIRACKQLFNLYFYTDHSRREVYVEPRNNFYASEPLIDLSDRIDLSRPIAVSDPAVAASRVMTFGYAPGDEAVGDYNRREGATLGEWSATVDSLMAVPGEKRYTNPIFSPSVNSTGAYSRAPSASLLRVGSERDPDEVNFPPKIVLYDGMTTLPSGQTWGWPGNTNRYPFVTFNAPDALLSLAFEDHGPLTGLHSHWDRTIGLMNNGCRVQLYIDLRPDDIEQFIRPQSAKRDFRARYRLTINGESAIYRLEEIADYNPKSRRSTKCTFIKEQ